MTVFQSVKSDLAGRLTEVLPDLLPGGTVRGGEYLCASLRGGRGHSCSINVSTGVGSDFATGEKWGDVIDLASQIWGTGQMEAARKLQERYGVNGGIRSAPIASPVDDGWTLIQPIPENAPELPVGYSGKWCYCDVSGAELFYVLRFDEPNGGKRVQPVSYWRDKDGGYHWRFKMPSGLRPLYGLDRLAKTDRNTPVLLVEGEKTADATQVIFPEYVCMTWSGGVNATGKSDFSPLVGRDVIVWPDNDAPGVKAADELSQVLGRVAHSVRIVPLPKSLPAKWDLADPCPEGFDPRVHLDATMNDNDRPKIEFLDAGKWLLEPVRRMPTIITGLLDVGDKLFVIGGPKTRKSFFCMQLALCLATGNEFLGFEIPSPCRVAVVQMEIQAHHYHARLSRLATAKAIDPASLGGKLYIANLRGVTASMDEITEALFEFKPQAVILDPLYKTYVQSHDENSAGDAAALLSQFDRMAKVLECAMIVIHHDNKSAHGGTKAAARGSGSNVLARDCDASLLLSAHAVEPDGLVLESLLRNYPPRDPVTVLWDVNRFVLANSVPAMPETIMTRTAKARRGATAEDLLAPAKELIADAGGKYATVELQEHLKNRFGVGRDKVNSAIQLLEVRQGYRRVRDPDTKKWYIAAPIELAYFLTS